MQSTLKIDITKVTLLFQIFYLLEPKIGICLRYFLDKNSIKQPLWQRTDMDEPLQKLLFSTVVRGDFSPKWQYLLPEWQNWVTQVRLIIDCPLQQFKSCSNVFNVGDLKSPNPKSYGFKYCLKKDSHFDAHSFSRDICSTLFL